MAQDSNELRAILLQRLRDKLQNPQDDTEASKLENLQNMQSSARDQQSTGALVQNLLKSGAQMATLGGKTPGTNVDVTQFGNIAQKNVNDQILRDEMARKATQQKRMEDQQNLSMLGDIERQDYASERNPLELQGLQQNIEKQRQQTPQELLRSQLQNKLLQTQVEQMPEELALKKKMLEMKTSADAKPVVEAQRNAALYSTRIKDAIDAMDKIEQKGYDRSSLASGIGSVLPNIVRSSDAQQQDQAERNFVNAVLRRESGAVISDQEFANAEKQYFPRGGDSPEVKEQKRQNRIRALSGIEAAAGPRALQDARTQYSQHAGEMSPPRTDKQRMQTPDGRVILVPQEKVEEARANGAKLL